jgi:hypothetical protein
MPEQKAPTLDPKPLFDAMGVDPKHVRKVVIDVIYKCAYAKPRASAPIAVKRELAAKRWEFTNA